MSNLVPLFIKNIGKFGKIKNWIFSDGKFNPIRALILLCSFILLLLSLRYFSHDDIIFALDQLDELSDIIGYEE